MASSSRITCLPSSPGPSSSSSRALSIRDRSPESTSDLLQGSLEMEQQQQHHHHHHRMLQSSVHSRQQRFIEQNQQNFQQNIQNQQIYGAAAAPRSVTSPNWRVPPTAEAISWAPSTSSNYVLASPTIPRGEVFDGKLGGYAYCLDRGNGQFTRLIPADMLPALVEIPARQTGPGGMVVLPALQASPPQGIPEMNRPVTFKASGQGSDTIQKHIDQIVATSPVTPKKPKIYCDKWVHEGVCAFTQQGCKYKHEMPLDKATQFSLGLFHGFPAWWKKLQADLQRQRGMEEPNLSPPREKALLGSSGGIENRGQVLNRQGWRRGSLTNPQSPTTAQSPPGPGIKKSEDALRPFSTTGPNARCQWGPIEPPNKGVLDMNSSLNMGSKKWAGVNSESHSRYSISEVN